MTVKEFAHLCGCNPQTLRYYDRVDLLKPASVDHWSGYRNYDEEQALAFVKIKNLQRAGFTIEEIKGLLSQEDATLYEAFTAKIAEAEENLRAIKAIQRSYRTEMNAMEKRIKEIRQTVHADLEAYDPKEEFGMDGAAYESLKQDVMRFFETIEKNASLDDYDFQEPEEQPDFFGDAGYQLVQERHGWTYAREFLAECLTLEDGVDYQFVFHVVEGKADDSAFANIALGLAILKNGKDPERKRSLGCTVSNSDDGKNHFWLFKRVK